MAGILTNPSILYALYDSIKKTIKYNSFKIFIYMPNMSAHSEGRKTFHYYKHTVLISSQKGTPFYHFLCNHRCIVSSHGYSHILWLNDIEKTHSADRRYPMNNPGRVCRNIIPRSHWLLESY